MGKNNSNKEVVVATSCAGIGAGAAIGIAAAVSAPVSLPIVLIGGALGCIGGAIISFTSK